ncbi:MAG: hypothetical protein A2Z99_11570 [Treponema sp. GWB1_62_6]|nr:MAG: hypothetical protein A2Y36_00685 [Treponema sp. GWA1_62_8]OHE68460.1 MAG: hypothetical protein A2Z99_11570 [Treponema sp. GWB1_62_6]OHE69121.1 MAG: hypothetical protein A2001_12835 [Treponema sp. GWC1_61_84]OHE74011.1 MAG: hypothetical protein A2413_10125 [Treponema sp. RIFOXYC1_FULL_61_9]HCM27080.1 TVP38/TMEM64 family protein [Treponema sp.]
MIADAVGSFFTAFGSSERLVQAVASTGPWGPFVFVLFQALQVVVFFLPGEIAQIAGGYLFGVARGTALSLLGIGIGSALDFLVARSLGRRFVAVLFGRPRLERFESILSSPRAAAAFFLLFVIPGIPKDLLCFVAGLSAIRVFPFLAISLIGRLPGIAGSSLMGAAVSDGKGGLFIAVALVAAFLFAAGVLMRERVHALAIRYASAKAPARPREEA